MSLQEKVGQVMLIGFDGTSLTPELREAIETLHVGGVILYDRNIASPQQLTRLNADLQQVARARGMPGLFIAIDQEGGTVARLKEDAGFTEFPSAMAIAASPDSANNARRVAQAMAAEMHAVGINLDFAPDLDVNNNPANPVISMRSFGSDPTRVAELGVAFADGLQSSGVLAVGKHFPGHGDTAVDSHVALPTVPHDRTRLERVEFVPFRAAMRANVAGIMSAHITFPAIDSTPGLAATLSSHALTHLLRGEMQYDGLIFTDELTMGALGTSGYGAPVASATALRAGADVLLFQRNYVLHRQAQEMILEWTERGNIPEARLDDAVRRVLIAKERFGLLDAPRLDPDSAATRVGTRETKTLAREIAEQSITLVRDDAHLLPLAPKAKLVVVETAQIGLGKQLGATTLQVSVQPKPDEINGVLQIARDGHTVIVATTDIAKNKKQSELIEALLKANVPTIVAAMRSPYDLQSIPNAPTYLATYGANPPLIEALAAVLTGKAQARGKLPVEL